MRAPTSSSLSSRLLRHVLAPLAFIWLAGTAMSFGIAWYFMREAFDRALLDDAHLLAINVRHRAGELELGLTADEVNRVLFDRVETMYFSVIRTDGALVGGTADLRVAPVALPERHRFQDLQVQGRTLRSVVLHAEAPEPFDVVIAATTGERTAALQRLVWLSLAPEVMLLALLAAWLRCAIRRDLEPLAQLQEAVGRRTANDLAPVNLADTSREVATLAGAINGLLTRLGRSVQSQREFAGNVAHELRTPLAGIRALADYGLAHSNPEVWREQLERIAASQARASRLVDQLLDVALALEAQAGLKLEPIRLDLLAREAVLRFLARADAAGVDLGAVGVDAAVYVLADATLAEGILNNLLDNALRYGVRTDGKQPVITVSVQAACQEVVLSVFDNGPGLPGELQAQLVERGAQGETGQLLGQGAGLGLALVSQYATQLQARMDLRTGPGGHGWLCAISFVPAPETAFP